MSHLVAGEPQRLVQHRFIGDDAARLQAAGGGHDNCRAGIVHTLGKFSCCEAAEHDGMNRA